MVHGYKKDSIMKKYITLLFSAIMLFCLTGCKEDKPEVAKGLAGEWKLSTWNNEAAAFDVYMELGEDGSFNLYQKVQTLSYEHFKGSFESKGGVLNGTYEDGIAWSGSYRYELSADGNTLSLASTASFPVTSTYVRTQIPSEVREAATTKSSVMDSPFRAL